jgi:hypothetical protein
MDFVQTIIYLIFDPRKSNFLIDVSVGVSLPNIMYIKNESRITKEGKEFAFK